MVFLLVYQKSKFNQKSDYLFRNVGNVKWRVGKRERNILQRCRVSIKRVCFKYAPPPSKHYEGQLTGDGACTKQPF